MEKKCFSKLNLFLLNTFSPIFVPTERHPAMHRGSLFVESLALDSLPNSRGEEDESLAIKPPQQITRKDKSHHRKEEKRKDKRRRRSHSAEGGTLPSWDVYRCRMLHRDWIM